MEGTLHRADVQTGSLMYAARRGDPGVVRRLLAREAHVGIDEDAGVNVAMWAAFWGHLDYLKMFLEAGGDPDLRDARGNNALHYAFYRNRKPVQVVKLLAPVMSDIDLLDAEGHSALGRAIQLGRLDIIYILITNGADLNRRDARGRTPAMIAVECGNLEALRFLFARGADLSLRDETGRTVYHQARSQAAADARTEARTFLERYAGFPRPERYRDVEDAALLAR